MLYCLSTNMYSIECFYLTNIFLLVEQQILATLKTVKHVLS